MQLRTMRLAARVGPTDEDQDCNEPLGDSLDSATNSKGFSPHRLKSSFCSLSPRNSRRHATPRFEHSSDGENLSKNSFVMTSAKISSFTLSQ